MASFKDKDKEASANKDLYAATKNYFLAIITGDHP
jgi:hypothetical protein